MAPVIYRSARSAVPMGIEAGVLTPEPIMTTSALSGKSPLV